MPAGTVPGLVVGAARFLPGRSSVETLREAVQACQGCEAHRGATQAVARPRPAHLTAGRRPAAERPHLDRRARLAASGRTVCALRSPADITVRTTVRTDRRFAHAVAPTRRPSWWGPWHESRTGSSLG